MGNSSVLARLPVKGTAIESRGTLDAFKIPLLNEEGKLNASLLIDDSFIYDVGGVSYGFITFNTPAVMPDAPTAGVRLFLDAQEVFRYVDSNGIIKSLVGARSEQADWNAPLNSTAAILNKPTIPNMADIADLLDKTQNILISTEPGVTFMTGDLSISGDLSFDNLDCGIF